MHMEARSAIGRPVEVTEVKVRLVDNGTDGLIGWASCVVNGALYLNNIGIRRSWGGELVLTYPCKRSRSNQRHFYFNPITHEAGRAMEDAILGKLERGERWPG